MEWGKYEKQVVIPFKSGLFFEYKNLEIKLKEEKYEVVIPFKSGLFFESKIA